MARFGLAKLGLTPVRGLAIVADRKQPVLDGETNPLLDQGSRNARYARPVCALSDQFFEIGDGRECQGDGDAVGFGFFRGHAKKLAFKLCTEKYLFRLYFNPNGVQLPVRSRRRTTQCPLSEVRVTSQHPPFTNLGKSWALAICENLVPLFYLTFLDRIRRGWCRNVK
jgi:hypothetical protein